MAFVARPTSPYVSVEIADGAAYPESCQNTAWRDSERKLMIVASKPSRQ